MPLFPATLRSRFLILFGIIFLFGGAAGYSFFVWYNDELVRTLGSRFAERNALYEKSKLLRVLVREITLAQKMASSPVLRNWVLDEKDRRARAQAVSEMEDFRRLFRSRSTFLVIAGSGNYYYSDDSGKHDPYVPSYTLSESIQKDGWFYATLRGQEDMQLNVDTDRHLGVTKIWINTVVRASSGRAIGVGGSGVDLSDFIRSVVGGREEGITNIALDQNGAIQAHPDVSLIDFASVRKATTKEEQNTVFNLLDRPADVAALRQAMAELAAGKAEVRTLELNVQGRRQLTGITWVPEMRWFVATLAHPEAVPHRLSLPVMGLAFAAAFGGVLLVAALIFEFAVMRRLSRLARAARDMGEGRYGIRLNDDSPDELGRLTRGFGDMAARIASHTGDLERQVQERTATLERMAYTDFLTGQLNRRGMMVRLDMERNRLARQGQRMGLLIVDIDFFKRINDHHGHQIGDRVIVEVAAILRDSVRDYDACARWGGEEFLVGMFGMQQIGELRMVANKLLDAVRQRRFDFDGTAVSVTVSIGGHLADPAENLDAMLQKADNALYTAKNSGRDRAVLAGEEPL